MQHTKQLLVGAVLLALASTPASAFLTADFNPAAGRIPSASNLLFTGSADGTLNIPNQTGNPLVSAMNALDGFATTLPITVTFSERRAAGLPDNGSRLDPQSVVAGDSVRVFEVDLVNPFRGQAGAPFSVNEVTRELTPGVDYVAAVTPLDGSGRTLAIVPIQPLKPKTSYMVVLTDGLRDTLQGMPVYPDLAYLMPRYRGMTPIADAAGHSNFPALSDIAAVGVQSLQPMILSQEGAAARAGVDHRSIVLSWTFTTQSTADVLERVLDQAAPQASALRPTGMSTADLGVGLPGLARIVVGQMDIPYYQDIPSDYPDDCPSCVVGWSWWTDAAGNHVTRYNPVPELRHPNLKIPVLVTVPAGPVPQGGFPVVVFQHGISSDRTNLLGIADTLASQGFAGVAIDLPLHGVDATSPFYQAGLERHFDIDEMEPIGERDPSELLFVNLSSPRTVRDNGRQAVSDLANLVVTIPTMDLDNDGVPDFNGNRMHIIGHSLGGIFTTDLLSFNTDIKAAVLASTLSQVIVSMPYSANFGPIFDERLGEMGILPGSAEYARVIAAVQAVVDSVDAGNYAAAAVEKHPILFTEVTTHRTDGYPPDGSVPNAVPGMPLAGSEPLIGLMGLTPVDHSYSDEEGVRAVIRFTEGVHSSIVYPVPAPGVTAEMQYQIAGFLASDGVTVPVNNMDLLMPVGVAESAGGVGTMANAPWVGELAGEKVQ